MPAAAIRRSIWALGIAALAAVVIVLCLPILASTQIVRDSVAQQVSAWSGYRVRLDEAPEIRVWPSFKAILNDVVLSDWRDSALPPVMEAERVEIDLSALAALRGEVVFTKLRLVRPVLHVDGTSGAPRLQKFPRWGRLAQSIEAARELIGANAEAPDLDALPSDALATVEIYDGRIVPLAKPAGPAIASGLAGTLTWPALNRAASLVLRGIWHGESIAVDASSQQPLLLLAGGKSAVSLSVKTAPVNLSYNGLADLSPGVFIDGRIEASAPSLQRFLEWATMENWPSSSTRTASLRSAVSGDLRRLKFGAVELGIGDSSATGAFEIGDTAPQPTVSGTLAFTSLDLAALLDTLTPDRDAAEPSIARRVNLDLRLSAASARAGSVAMSDVAATAQVRDGLVSLDISDATAFGGVLQLGVRVDNMEGGHHAELRISAENIDGAQIADTFHLTSLAPRARGSFSVFVKGHGETLQQMLETADGTVTAAFGKGTVPGLNLESFRAHNNRGTFFPLADIGDGTLAIDGIDLKATLAGGIAWIDKAEVKLPTKERITFGGLIPIAGRGIALSGSIGPAEPAAEAQDEPKETFFIGGSWSAPFIAPFLIE